MKYLIAKFSLLGLAIVLLSGCAGSRNVPMQAAFWQNPKQKITIVAIKPPKPAIHTIGGQGLIDVAITSIANNELDKSVKKADLNWYKEIPQDLAERLKKSHTQTSVITTPIENDKKSIEAVAASNNSDLLLTLELKSIGARREYAAGFIPSGGPEGYCVLVGELINPKDKKVVWRHETEITQKVQGKWDQPPHFPNFNVALNQAVTEAKQELLDSFFSGR